MTFIRRTAPTGLQQRREHAQDRQQQQDNGTHEFQPAHPVQRQQGDADGDDSRYSLAAYLDQARQRGDMPVPRPAAGSHGAKPNLYRAK